MSWIKGISDDTVLTLALSGVTLAAVGIYNKKHSHKKKKKKEDKVFIVTEELIKSIGNGTANYQELSESMSKCKVIFDEELKEKIKTGRINVSKETSERLDCLMHGKVPGKANAQPGILNEIITNQETEVQPAPAASAGSSIPVVQFQQQQQPAVAPVY